MTTYKMSLSTTEPNNYVGIIKVRRNDINTQVFEISITENGIPKQFIGLAPFFCLLPNAKTGSQPVEDRARSVSSTAGIIRYTVTENATRYLGTQTAYFSFRKLESDGSWSEQFSTKTFDFVVEESIQTLKFDDQTYLVTLNELNEKFQEYIENGKNSWEEYLASNKEILESLDANGELLSKVIDLSNSSTTKLIANIDQTSYLKDQRVDTEAIRQKQAAMFYQFMKRLRDSKETLKILHLGDSLTYGSDVTNTRPGTNGSSITRAATTYPEAFEIYMNQVFKTDSQEDRIFSINNGFPGDWIPRSFERNATKQEADLSIIMLGTNDARRAIYEDAGKVDVYLDWYEQMIIREILWDRPVLLLSPPKTKSFDLAVDSFRQAVRGIADKYNIPLIDTTKVFEHYSASIYSDDTHFTAEGYKVLGARVAAALIGEGPQYKQEVYSGSILLPRTLNNVVLIKNAAITGSTGAYAPAPNEQDVTKSLGVLLAKGGGEMIFSFYAKHENIIALPYFLCSADAVLTVTLDFATQQAQNALDTAISDSQATLEDNTPNKFIYDATGKSSFYARRYSYLSNNIEPIRINQKGWHTLKFESTGNSIGIHGIQFLSFQEWDNLKRIYSLESK